MKNKGMFILVLCLLLLSTVAVSAKSASELIGSITGYVEEIQSYPAVINEALCNGDKDEYSLKMGELSDLIQAANDAMAEAGLPNTLNLWAVYGAITANPHCGVHDAALSRADWSREELDRIGYAAGLYDTDETGVRIYCLYGTHIGMTKGQLYDALKWNKCTAKCDAIIYRCGYNEKGFYGWWYQ